VTSSFGHANEAQGSIARGEFLD